MGLAITQHFCEVIGGTIDIKSHLGTGTTFIISLPSQVSKQTDQESSEAPLSAYRSIATPPPASTLGTVLIIDDELFTLDLMERFLQKEGYQDNQAKNGKEGLQLAKELRPHVITFDVMMPDMDGWSVLSAIKEDAELAEIPVIMVTMIDDRSMGYTLGATDFLVKPVERERLLSIIQKHIHNHHQIKRNKQNAILIVEDDEATREVIVRMLKKEG